MGRAISSSRKNLVKPISFRILMHMRKTNRSWDFHFPSNLKILVLRDFPLTSDSLSTIAGLPNLEELFLERTIIQGGEWMIQSKSVSTFLDLCFRKDNKGPKPQRAQDHMETVGGSILHPFCTPSKAI